MYRCTPAATPAGLRRTGIAFCMLMVLPATRAGNQPLTGAVPDAQRMLVRVPLEPGVERIPGFDPCAIDRTADGPRAVLHVTPVELAQLLAEGVAVEPLGDELDHLRRHFPVRTYAAAGRIPSLEPALTPELEARIAAVVPQRRDGQRGRGVPGLEYDRYHSLQEGIDFLSALADFFPDIATVVDIGDSVEGRDILALKITDDPLVDEPDEAAIVITGVTHAREWATHEAVLYLAEQLTTRYGEDDAIRHVVDNSVIWLVATVNPDGYAYTWSGERFWRKNRANVDADPDIEGVDINRNYDYLWGYDDSGSSGSQGSETYRGPAPGSEPETQAIQALLADRKPAVAVSFHTYSQLVLYSWGYTGRVTPESYTPMRALGNRYAYIIRQVSGQVYLPGQSNYTIYATNGDFNDYAYGAQGVMALTPELRPRTSTDGGFALPEEQILPTCEENFAACFWLMQNVANARSITHPTSPSLIEQPALGDNPLSLPRPALNQKPGAALGLPATLEDRLTTLLDDDEHVPPVWGTLADDFEGVGTGSGYVLSIDDGDALAWAEGLSAYRVLPHVFEDGADVMLSNAAPGGENVIGIPSDGPVHMQDIRIVARVVRFSGNSFGYVEEVIEERTALQDLSAPDSWIDWTWTWESAAGDVSVSHPTGADGASEFVEPFRAYRFTANVRSAAFDSSGEPVYLLRFPGFNDDCNYNGALDFDDVTGGFSDDCDGNGVPDECQEDCNANGVADACEPDCNGNGVADECDLEPTPGFAGPEAYGVGDAPQHAAIGDVDFDGDPDLAVANRSSDDVTVLLNDGAGGFTRDAAYPVGDFPKEALILDLDGDGDPDIVTANVESSDVSVLLNRGDGTFEPETRYGGLFGAYALAAADVNDDGAPDLAVALSTARRANILLNGGDGTFSDGASLLMGRSPQSVLLHDLDQDQRPDLVTADLDSDTVSVRPGLGGGNFAGRTTYPVGAEPKDVVAGDLDGDGDADLVVANASAGSLSILRNRGDGTLDPAENYGVQAYAKAVTIADFDDDGHPDIAAANRDSGTVSLLTNQGAGTFEDALTVMVDSPWSVEADDLDGDGAPDLAIPSRDLDAVSVLLNTTTASADCNANGVPDECDVADGASDDRNGNGVPDECECIGDLNGDGEVGLDDLSILLGAFGSTGAGDLDGDGDTDLTDLSLLLGGFGGVCE